MMSSDMESNSDASEDGSMISDLDEAFSFDQLGSDETGDSSARNSEEDSEEEDGLTPEEIEKLKEEKKRRKEQLARRKKEEQEKMPRTLFVGNLPTSATRVGLAKLFAPFGKVESVRLRGAVPADGAGRGLKKKAVIQQQFHAQQRTICGFVVFGAADSCQSAIARLNGRSFQGRHLRVDAAGSGGANFRPRHCVFVGGLPYVAEEEAVREHFETCGSVVNVRIVRDKCGAPKGIAFVEFEEEAGAVLALKRHGSELCGRAVRVQRWSKPKGEEQGKKKKKKERGEVAERGRGGVEGRGRGRGGFEGRGGGRGGFAGRGGGRGGMVGRGRGREGFEGRGRGRGGFEGRGRGREGFDGRGRGRGGRIGRGGGRGRFEGRGRGREGFEGRVRGRGGFEGRGRGRGARSDRGGRRVHIPSSLHKNERKAFVKRAIEKKERRQKSKRKSKGGEGN